VYGSRVKLVVMVILDRGADGFPRPCWAALEQLFDEVVDVPQLQHRHRERNCKRFRNMYTWIDKAFTKLAMMGLDHYDKIAFLDADMLAVGPTPDDVFAYKAPAGICTAVTNQADYDGRPVPQPLIEAALDSDYGVRGCISVLKPDKAVHKAMLASLQPFACTAGDDCYGTFGRFLGPDEEFITEFYKKDWTHLHAKFGCTAWKDKLLGNTAPVFIHFVSEKPWISPNSWGDFKKWYAAGERLIKDHPKLRDLFGRETLTRMNVGLKPA
jgi:hypothetical protein